MRFQCVIGGHPLPWSTWDKNGVIVTPAARVRIMDRDDLRILEIEHVTMDDSGLYRITLENDYGRIETTARLDVITNRRSSTRMMRACSASPRRPYHWTRRIRGNSTAIGGRLALASDIRGKSLPPSTRRFYCNGEEVRESDRIKIIDDGGSVAQLVIDPVMESDQGIYMCVAEFESDFDPIVMVCATEYLRFPESDDIMPFLKMRKALDANKVIEEGFECDLVCEVECSGDFVYSWLKDGKPVPNGEDFQYIDYGSGIIALRLSDPFVLDSGNYTCVIKATSGGAQVESNCTLAVIERNINDMESTNQSKRPEFIKLPLPVFTRSGSDVSFVCRVEPSDAELMWVVNGRAVNNETNGVAVSWLSKRFSNIDIFM